MANQQLANYDERYKFTGKERDEETGYDYFGARYYVPEIPIWLSVDPLSDKYPQISPYAYCEWNPIKFVDPDGRDWYEAEDGTSVFWKNSNDASINVNGVSYNNIGANYNQTVGNTTYGYHQNELASISANVMSNENFISQYSKDDWNGTPAGKACNKACDAMLASAGFTSGSPSPANTIVENIDGRAGNASGNARSIISQMTDKLYAGYPLKACVDHKPGSSVADGIGDHFVVLMGVTEYLSKGNVTGYSYRFFDPGTKWTEKGVSGTFNLSNGRLIGVAPYGNHRPYTVTSLRFCR